MKDPYLTLGVAKNANDTAIKAAYKKLAVQWHPDKNQGSKAAETKFKEIAEAYSVLSDKEKRGNYDTFGDISPNMNHMNQRFRTETFNFSGDTFNVMGDLNDILRQAFGNHRPTFNKNSNLQTVLEINLEDVFYGVKKDVELVSTNGIVQTISIDVPKGVDNGTRLQLSGKGSTQNVNAPPGDLIIVIKVKEDPIFKRHGSDLFIRKKISILNAALGKKIVIKTIDGREIKVSLPSGVQPNQKIRLSKEGLPSMRGYGMFGDMYLLLTITIPTNLTDKQKELLEEFEKEEVNKKH